MSWGGYGGNHIEGDSCDSNRIVPCVFHGDGGVPG